MRYFRFFHDHHNLTKNLMKWSLLNLEMPKTLGQWGIMSIISEVEQHLAAGFQWKMCWKTLDSCFFESHNAMYLVHRILKVKPGQVQPTEWRHHDTGHILWNRHGKSMWTNWRWSNGSEWGLTVFFLENWVMMVVSFYFCHTGNLGEELGEVQMDSHHWMRIWCFGLSII